MSIIQEYKKFIAREVKRFTIGGVGYEMFQCVGGHGKVHKKECFYFVDTRPERSPKFLELVIYTFRFIKNKIKKQPAPRAYRIK